MLFYIFKIWLYRQFDWFYYRNNTVSVVHLNSAFKFIESVDEISTIISIDDDSISDFEHYGEYVLGHYFISSAAAISRRTYLEVITPAPLDVQADTEKLQVWVGSRVWDYRHSVISGASHIPVVLRYVFGLSPSNLKPRTQQDITYPSMEATYEDCIETLISIAFKSMLSEVDSPTSDFSDANIKRLTVSISILKRISKEYQLQRLVSSLNDVSSILAKVNKER